MRVIEIENPMSPVELQLMIEHCLDRRDDINNEYRNKTPLMHAIDSESIDTVKILILNGANPIFQLNTENSPLFQSIKLDNYEMTKFLIDIGAHTCYTVRHETPLYWAIQTENLAMIRLLLDNGATFTLFNGLVAAVESNSLDIVKLLLSYKADINRPDSRGIYPIMCAVRQQNCEMVELLASNKANLEVRFSDGETLLTKAASMGNNPMVKYLVSARANLNSRSRDGESALTKAIILGEMEMFRVLIAAGAEVSLSDNVRIERSPPAKRQALLDCLEGLGRQNPAEGAR